MYVQNRNKLTDIENRFVVTKEGKKVGRCRVGYGINRYTLICKK